jgi:NAD(P)-dependent dehydrogenase (short-subunit alcohol dehydrogenase family)
VALVTGTSTGLGLWTAVGPARAGLRVVATMRDPGRSGAPAEAAAEQGAELTVLRLDVTDAASATGEPRFRWQTAAGASAFAGLSVADLNGSRVLAQTTTWLD